MDSNLDPAAASDEPAPASTIIPLLVFGDPPKEHRDVSVRFGLYQDDLSLIPAMQLYTGEPPALEPLTEATVNVPLWGPADGCVLIRDWGDNTGLVKGLRDAGVVEETGLVAEANEFGSLAREVLILPPWAAELESVLIEGQEQ